MKDLVFSIKKHFAIFLHFQRIHIMKMMAYPLSFFISCVAASLSMLLGVLFIKVNFGYINSLVGWSYYQVLAVMGSYMIMEGLMWTLFAQLNSINNHINSGTMDGILLKPVDSQFLISFWRGDLEDWSRVVIGLGLIMLSIKNTVGFDFLRLILFLVLLVNGLIIFYGLALFVRSFSFWVIEGSNFWLLVERISANSQYPVDIYYNKIVRGIFTFVIPLAFMSTVPAKILTYKIFELSSIAVSFLFAFIFFLGSRLFWKFSLKYYSSASS